MAKDFLNVIERALMMGISDGINTLTENGENIHVYGEYPEVEELKFPAIIVEHTGSGFEEQFMGQKVTMGSSSGTGETYGASYTIHIICEKETTIQVGTGHFSASDAYYKQRRLLNWIMINLANTIMDLDWSTFDEEETQVLERHLNSWQNIGFIPDLQWYGASADFLITFTNVR